MAGNEETTNLRQNSKEESTGPHGQFNVGDTLTREKIELPVMKEKVQKPGMNSLPDLSLNSC